MISAFLANLKFELNIRRRSISTYVYFLMFFSLALMMSLSVGGAFPGVNITFGLSSKVFYNTSVSLTMFISLLSTFSLFIIAPAFGQAVVKDYSHQFDQIIYSAPVDRRIFLTSRFLAALIFMLGVLTSMGLGIYVSTKLPFILASAATTNVFANYLQPYLLIVLPNLFIFGSIIFLIASKSKKMAPVYVVTILIFMGWLISGKILSEIDNKLIGSLLDPFGLKATAQSIKYWSVDQQNTRLLTLHSFLLYNRLTWLGVGLACFALSLTSFDFAGRKGKPGKEESKAPARVSVAIPQSIAVSYSTLKMFWRQLRFEHQQIYKSVYFQTLVLAGVCFMFVAGQSVGRVMGTNTFPVTYMVLDMVGGSFDLFLIVIVALFAGEVVWRDRDQKTQQIIDSYPVPNLALIGAKFLTLISMICTLFLMVIVCGVIIQIFYGYYNFEIPLYLKTLYGKNLLYYINLIALAFFVHVVANNKYLAHGIVALYYLIYTWGPSMGLEHKLFYFNSAPFAVYSDMNGFGHFLVPTLIYRFLWMTVAIVMMVLAYLFWQRGNLAENVDRMREFHRRNTGRTKAVMLTSLVVFVATSGFLYYNTNVLLTYRNSATSEKKNVDFEKLYSGHRYDPQPQITAVRAKVDIFPEFPGANIDYAFTLVNRTAKPIETIFLNLPSGLTKAVKFQLNFDRDLKIEKEDTDQGVRIYRFDKPLQPNEELKIGYAASYKSPTFFNIGNEVTSVLENGTFFSNGSFNMSLGYEPDRELEHPKTREKYGLPERARMPSIDDARERQFNALGRNSSWIDFEATVSTSADQIAIAPGYLQKTWEENGRKYFHYKMDKKILNFYSFLSGRYAVIKDKWNDVDIEIYHHPSHTYNIDGMVQASKDSLDYFTKNYGPYQFRQYRVIEFPRYASFAQSFPNTVPFSEAIGFVARVRPEDPKDVDYPYFITAHEMAHQWWGHQVIPAGVQGAHFVTESFAEYTALMVLQKKYGREKMQRFLRHELESYLFGRTQEEKHESPLALSEGQSYVHYRKGSIALFALKEAVGEDVVNGAIREYLEKVRFQYAPFTVATEFLDILKRRVPTEHLGLVSDLLEKMVIFENRPLSADYKKLKEDLYEVRLKVNATKYYSDGAGKEVPTDFTQDFDVGVTDSKGDYLYLKKHKFIQGENEIVVQVDRQPSKAGIDPLNYVIDRTPDDNMMNVNQVGADSKVL